MGDVHAASARVFVAHTANDSVQVIVGELLAHHATIPGCQEGSGVLCSQDDGMVVAAAGGAGKVPLIDAMTEKLLGEMRAGSKPNGLAWDTRRKHLLAADVGGNSARILDPSSERVLSTIALPGRPRWSVYHPELDLFLVNIREPSGVFAISAESMRKRFIPVFVAGPYGLDIEKGMGREFVACDAKAVVVLDLATGKEVAIVPIAGEPDVVWHSQEKNRLYCATGSPGVIYVLDTRKLVIDEQIRTEEGAHIITFDPARLRIYAFLPGSRRASVYEEV